MIVDSCQTRRAVNGERQGLRSDDVRIGRASVIVWVALCGLILAGGAAAQTLTPGMELEGIAAIVGTDVILRSELSYQLQIEKAQSPGIPDSSLRAQILQSMIDQKILYMKAVEDSVQVTDDDVNQELDFKLQQIIQGYGSEKRVEEVYGKSVSQIKRDYREDVRKSILGRRWLQQKLTDQPRATRQDVEKFAAQFHDTLVAQRIPLQYDCATIALKVNPNASARDSARAKAMRLLDSLQHGASFAELAKRHSEDASSASKGGDLGFQKRGIFVREFDQAAFSLKEGQTSGIVETVFGYHIINVVERRGEEVHARHILVMLQKSKEDEQAAIDALAKIRDSVLAAASSASGVTGGPKDGARESAALSAAFGKMARERSDDGDTRAFGGDLGPLSAAAQPDAVARVLKALKPGEISAPVKSSLTSGDAAYRIFFLKQIIPEHAPTLETDYKQIERITLQWLQQQNVEALMRDVRAQVYWAVTR